MKIIYLLILCGMTFSYFTLGAQQQTIESQVHGVINNTIKLWLDNSLIIESIQRQNAQHSNWTQAQIEQWNAQWQAELNQPKKPLIDQVIHNNLSRYLQNVQVQGQNLYHQIIILDNKGCIVGQIEPTQSYCQSNQMSWQRTFLQGPNTIFIEPLQQDLYIQNHIIAVHMTLSDPNDGRSIGMATVLLKAEHIITPHA